MRWSEMVGQILHTPLNSGEYRKQGLITHFGLSQSTRCAESSLHTQLPNVVKNDYEIFAVGAVYV